MKRFIFTIIIVLFSVNVYSQNAVISGGIIPPDGTYCAKKLDNTYKNEVYIVVKNAKITGVFKDKVNEKNRVKTAKVFFAKHDDKGMHELYSIADKIDGTLDENGCQNLTVAVNTKDKKSTYYVWVIASREECWYEFDD